MRNHALREFNSNSDSNVCSEVRSKSFQRHDLGVSSSTGDQRNRDRACANMYVPWCQTQRIGSRATLPLLEYVVRYVAENVQAVLTVRCRRGEHNSIVWAPSSSCVAVKWHMTGLRQAYGPNTNYQTWFSCKGRESGATNFIPGTH